MSFASQVRQAGSERPALWDAGCSAGPPCHPLGPGSIKPRGQTRRRWAGRVEDTPPGFPSGSQPTQQPRGQRHSQSPRHPLARHLGGAPAPRRGRRRQPASGGGGGGVTPPGERSRLCSSCAGPYPGPCPAAPARAPPPRPTPRRPRSSPARLPSSPGQSFMLISSRRP